jgi:hypothetical protein
MRDRTRFATGFVAGVPLALAGLISGLIVMFAALVAALLSALYWGRAAGGGVLFGLGLVWTTVFTVAAYDCGRPEAPCGATPPDMTPHVVLSLILIIVGVALAASSRRSSTDALSGARVDRA